MHTEYDKGSTLETNAAGGNVRIYTGNPHFADGKTLSFRLGTEECLRLEPDGGIFFRREFIGSDPDVASCMWRFFYRLVGNMLDGKHNIALASGVGAGDGPHGAIVFYTGSIETPAEVLRFEDKRAFVRGVETHDPENIIGGLRMFLVGMLSSVLRMESEGKSWLLGSTEAATAPETPTPPEEAPPAPEGVPES